jgi:hypothetical protein
MSKAIKEYDARLDAKKRILIRGAKANYYHVTERADGTIELSPRVLAHPDEISKKTLSTLEKSVDNLKKGQASAPLNLDELKALNS